jgi:hypothetical protein
VVALGFAGFVGATGAFAVGLTTGAFVGAFVVGFVVGGAWVTGAGTGIGAGGGGGGKPVEVKMKIALPCGALVPPPGLVYATVPGANELAAPPPSTGENPAAVSAALAASRLCPLTFGTGAVTPCSTWKSGGGKFSTGRFADAARIVVAQIFVGRSPPKTDSDGGQPGTPETPSAVGQPAV